MPTAQHPALIQVSGAKITAFVDSLNDEVTKSEAIDRRVEGDQLGYRTSAGGQIDAPDRHICRAHPQTQGEEGYEFDPGDQIYRRKTDSNHKFNIAPNLLDRNFTADQPNQKWVGDISFVWTREGWLYLALDRHQWCLNQWRIHWQPDKVSLLGLHSRRVIGWAVSNRMKRDLAIRALNMAIAFRAPPKDCIYYPAGDYEVICREATIRTGAANIVHTIIRRYCASMASRCR